MEITFIVFLTILFTVGSIGIGFCVFQFVQHKNQLETQLQDIKNMLAYIAKGHQLSTILDIKGAVLSVSPEQFEPRKEVLLKAVEEQINIKAGMYEEPDTWAFVVIQHSGLHSFLDGNTRQGMQKALARLRANGDNEGALNFARDIVNQLGVPTTTTH